MKKSRDSLALQRRRMNLAGRARPDKNQRVALSAPMDPTKMEPMFMTFSILIDYELRLNTGGFDLLYSLKHTCSMFSGHLKRPSHRT